MDEPSDAEDHSQSSAGELDLQPSDSSDSDSDAESDSSTAARQPAKLKGGGMDREKTRKLAAKELNSTLSSDSSDYSDDESDSEDEHSGGSGTRKLPEYSLARELEIVGSGSAAGEEEEDGLFANMDEGDGLPESREHWMLALPIDETDTEDQDAMLSERVSFSTTSQNARLRTREKNQAQAKHSIDSVFRSGKNQNVRPLARFTQVRKVHRARIADLENCESRSRRRRRASLRSSTSRSRACKPSTSASRASRAASCSPSKRRTPRVWRQCTSASPASASTCAQKSLAAPSTGTCAKGACAARRSGPEQRLVLQWTLTQYTLQAGISGDVYSTTRTRSC